MLNMLLIQSQKLELAQLLKSRENVVDFLSSDPTTSDRLYQDAEKLLAKADSVEVIETREKLLRALNLHILRIAYDDSDKKIVHFRHITRVVPEFFTDHLTPAECASIKQLHCSGLHLKTLPDSISKLVNVEILTLNSNDIKVLPNSLSELHHLSSLDVSDNQLESIPEGILRLPSLVRLDISNNQFSSDERKKISEAAHIEIIDNNNSSALRRRR